MNNRKMKVDTFRLQTIILIVVVIALIVTTALFLTKGNKKGDKTSTKNVIMLCSESQYNPDTKNINKYTSTLQDENEQQYIIYTNNNIKDKWFDAEVEYNKDKPNDVSDYKIIDIKDLK